MASEPIMLRLSALLLLVTPTATQNPAPGISLELAERRAASIGHVGYQLAFDLDENAEEVAGVVEIRFSLARPEEPIVIDFAGHALDDAELNGKTLTQHELVRVHDHLVLKTDRARSRNRFRARFKSRVAATGTPLTRYEDKTDGKDYLYTLVVPADAHRLFPCFDQPDLKAMFALKLTTPADWTAVANEPLIAAPKKAAPGRLLWEFRTTQVLPTYLFAFAAGPFEVVDGPVVDFSLQKLPDTARPLRIFVRSDKKARLEAERLFAMHLKSLRWYEDYFAYKYPFSKLDIVLCPGFPYGGMEHAGCIFYRESALVFDHEPTEVETLRRSSLVYHEVAHQWFGNLVTMRWFDDLWLKEGFATFMGYSVLAALEPERKSWLRFHQRVKPAAYRVDVTAGTAPIYQQLANLDDAKSNYGPIVYNKAPAVLRELEQRITPATFRKGVQVFLQQYAFNNAAWKELLGSYELAGAEQLGAWSSKWILGKGMPRVRASFETDGAGRVASFRVHQTSAQGWPTGAWPLQLTVLVDKPDGPPHRLHVRCDHAMTDIEELRGKPAPRWVLLNPDDVAYGQFLLDPHTALTLPSLLIDENTRFQDPLLRAVAVRALVEMVREVELRPSTFVEVLVALLADERDPVSFASLLGQARTAIDRWLDEDAAELWRGRLEHDLRRWLLGGELENLELEAFRALARLGRSDATLELLASVCDGKREVPGLELGPQDRFLAGAALLAAAQSGAAERLDTLRAGAAGDVEKYHYMALAAAPDPAVKARYFESFLDAGEPPEQWVAGCLGFFHWHGQEELTLGYLEKALDRLAWVKANRKIFFLPTWIDAFVNAHCSRQALATVEEFLRQHADLSQDIRRKLLQSVDSLRRTVRIRARW